MRRMTQEEWEEAMMGYLESRNERNNSRRRGCILILCYLAAIFAVMLLFWIQATGGF